ncbi:dipeptidase [Paenibacillus athensensis]|uniref:Membrane dipeptidase n=1 Tax=Paenibacillus athensensis TaxID=1967502 RepID=A0A4Y8QC06_9BACL|nr:dipeptidase [Paenibacillus athensensis]MCD1257739.1 dipeptidase [Paenibacillus athensensis]
MYRTIIDGHCDALAKLYAQPELDFYKEEQELDVSWPRLRRAGVSVQFFAIYVSESLGTPRFEHVLHMIDTFHRKVNRKEHVVFIRDADDLLEAEQSGRLGALLTLEGVDALGGDLAYVRLLYHLGVRSVGITWNHANWAADGVMEPRKGGFTVKGRQLVKQLDRLGILIDVSHLSVQGFWELTELYEKPFIASHSNTCEHCAHPRNLSNEQLAAIIDRGGQIGLTFVPYFVRTGEQAAISDLLRHLDHVCSLGGEGNVGFGSDFDGIEQWVTGLEHAGCYENIIEALCKNYSEEQVQRFLHGNWRRFLIENLPQR